MVPYCDAFLLEPHCAGADDKRSGPLYAWDAAWCAALARSGRDEEADSGRRKVEEE